MIMKIRQVVLIALLAVTALAVPMSSASASPRPASLNTQDNLCLNLQNCGSTNWASNPVQLWNIQASK
jgi:hypothetical protein